MPEHTLAGVNFISSPGAQKNPQVEKMILKFQGDLGFSGSTVTKPPVQIKCLGVLDNSSTIKVSGQAITDAQADTLTAAELSTSTQTLTYFSKTYTVHITNLTIRESAKGSQYNDFDADCLIVATY